MEFLNPYMSIALKIQELQTWVLVHSFLYYELNTNIVSDKMYDANAKQLWNMMQLNPEEALKSPYQKVFEDYMPDTGFDLYSRLNREQKKYIKKKARIALMVCR